MKRNFLAVCALVLTVLVSSFTTNRVDYIFMDYDGSGAETSISNFAEVTPQPIHELTTVLQTLNWVRVEDANSNTDISQAEFDVAFAIYNVVSPGSNLLKDEAADVSGELDLKNK